MSVLAITAAVLFLVIFILISASLVNESVIALVGAVIFILLGIINQELAFEEVDWNVIFLLIGMMIIVGITKQTGIFQYVAIKSAKLVKGDPIKIMILFALITAVFSALLDNVTTVLILTPVIILISIELHLDPIPFVITSAMASNIGGTATLIGDPPNVMIGSAAGLGFLEFIINLGPVILIILTVFCVIFYLLFRSKLKVSTERKARIMEFDESKSIQDKVLLIKSLSILGIVMLGFLFHGVTGIEPATIALFGAAFLMLLTGKKEVEKFYHEVEWETIFFFIGLFILVGGLVHVGIIDMLAQALLKATNNNIAHTSEALLWISGFFSSVVNNIPFVATLIPLVENMGDTLGQEAVRPVWWSLALGSCLGGNGTLIGASANVVSAGIAGKSGYKISFLRFSKYGMLMTVISLFISSIYIYLVYLV